MVQIKVTPEMLEEVANRASNTRIALESIHNNLCNEIIICVFNGLVPLINNSFKCSMMRDQKLYIYQFNYTSRRRFETNR